MNAVEFVKKHGFGVAKKFANMIGLSEVEGVSTSDLKRLVEAHELVEKFGGLHMAKADAMDLDGWEKTSPYWMKIKQAIADVEKCQ